MTDATAARLAALRILSAVSRGRTFDDAREGEVASLPVRDRGLAFELSAGVLRRRNLLDDAIAPLVRGNWTRLHEDVKNVLRLGLYQMWFLDRIPRYAAVATSVDLVRHGGHRRAAGLVNAVLRRLTERSPPCLTEAPTTTDDMAHRHSTPPWLVERWVSRFGLDQTLELLRWNDLVPPIFLQPLRESARELCQDLTRAGIDAELAPFDAGVQVQRVRPPDIPGYAEGRWIVQDPAQALAMSFAAIDPGAVVYDVCAAPGGKSARLAVDHTVISADRDRNRISLLRHTLERTGGSAYPVIADAETPAVAKVDAVLLDAPCTGTGSMRRHPDARHRLRPSMLTVAVDTQSRLLDSVAGAVRPEGQLVYVTCSLEPEENEHQIEDFLARHADFRREPAAAPEGTITAAGDLMLLPHRHGTDGAFASRLRRM